MILFEPTDQAMVLEYPELQGIDEFRQLSDQELRFVWYYASVHSPLKDVKTHADKVNRCIKASYKTLPSAIEIKQLTDGNFHDSLKMAIDRMRKFSDNARNRARSMVEKVFDTFENIIDSTSDDESLSATPAKQSAYIDNASKIINELPGLIKMKEEGFGFKIKRGKGDGKQPTLMDQAMREDN